LQVAHLFSQAQSLLGEHNGALILRLPTIETCQRMAHVAPDRLSLVNSVHILRNAVFAGQIVAASQRTAWHDRVAQARRI
jgi:hypothetical protein